MTWEWLALTGLALAAVVLLLALARLRGRTNRQVDAARAEAAELRARLDRLEQERSEAVRPPVRDQRDHRITGVGVSETGPRPSSTADEYEIQPARLERAVFADHMLREGVIRLGAEADAVASVLFALADGLALRMLSETDRDWGPTIDAGALAVRQLILPV